MKKNDLDMTAANNGMEKKEAVSFFAKSGSPKNFKETIKLVLNLAVNLFG